MYVLLTYFMVCSNVDANRVHVARQIRHALYHELIFAGRSDDITRCAPMSKRIALIRAKWYDSE